MWKSVTRGIRESLERRICRTNVYSQSSQDGGGSGDEILPCDKQFLAPKFSVFYHICCKHTGQVDTKDEESQSKYDAKYTWSEAFGWSSILAVGYVVCQSLCIRRKLFEIDNNSKLDIWRDKINPHLQASRLLSNFLPQPKYILPVSVKPVQPKITPASFVDNSINAEQPYGPITAEEALEQAINEFSNTHNSIMGALELDSGSRAIEEERYEEAIEHFTTGANLSSVESMFNLGLCYEMGLGTSTDFEKAVKYYKDAADRGHADAMYNLGVFYAQGKGGLKINLHTARQLFTEAAKKGQVQASQALELEKLELEKVHKIRSNSKRENKYHIKVKSMQNSTEDSIMTNLMNYNSIFTTDFNNQTSASDQYDINSYETSPTSIFLDMLGVHERSAIPLISVGESGP